MLSVVLRPFSILMYLYPAIFFAQYIVLNQLSGTLDSSHQIGTTYIVILLL